MEINKDKINSLKFLAFVDQWDEQFDSYQDAKTFCSYNKLNYPKSEIRIEIRLTETLKWDGEHGEYKDHILGTINF